MLSNRHLCQPAASITAGRKARVLKKRFICLTVESLAGYQNLKVMRMDFVLTASSL